MKQKDAVFCYVCHIYQEQTGQNLSKISSKGEQSNGKMGISFQRR